MSKENRFWDFFNIEAAPQLNYRERTFRRIFEHLDLLAGPVIIVETGCLRMANNWSGDGQSTLLFDKYIGYRDQTSECHTVDIDPSAVSECKNLVSQRVQVNQSDSVQYLNSLSRALTGANKTISLLYLDSYDVDMTYWQPAAAHHLKELLAAFRCVNERTLVVVDDCPLNANLIRRDGNQFALIGNPSVGGKGRLVAEFADAVGAKLEFAEYQAGWTGF